MTSNNENAFDRLGRIEAIVESNSRAIQAMMEQRATDRLEHEERIRFLEENQRQLIQTQRGIATARVEHAETSSAFPLASLVSSLDEDRPTVLRKLTAIENKVDSLIERDR
jgi:hypothetical protein